MIELITQSLSCVRLMNVFTVCTAQAQLKGLDII